MNEERQIGDEPPREDTRQEDWSQQPQQQQPQQPPQQPQQGYQQEPSTLPQHQMPQKQDTFEGLSKNSTVTTVVVVGILIMMVGAILINAATFSDDTDTINDVTNVGNILQDIGVFLAAGFMVIASIYRDDWPKWIRIGTLTFSLLLILVAWFGFLAPLFQFG